MILPAILGKLPSDLKLRTRDLTILLTDLRGFAELYGKTGDVFAYKLVQNNCDMLHRAAEKHSGGIIKTMRDAIGEAFSPRRISLI